jgi:hypothetical protein
LSFKKDEQNFNILEETGANKLDLQDATQISKTSQAQKVESEEYSIDFAADDWVEESGFHPLLERHEPWSYSIDDDCKDANNLMTGTIIAGSSSNFDPMVFECGKNFPDRKKFNKSTTKTAVKKTSKCREFEKRNSKASKKNPRVPDIVKNQLVSNYEVVELKEEETKWSTVAAAEKKVGSFSESTTNDTSEDEENELSAVAVAGKKVKDLVSNPENSKRKSDICDSYNHELESECDDHSLHSQMSDEFSSEKGPLYCSTKR